MSPVFSRSKSIYLNNRQQTAQEQVEKLKKAKAEFLNPNQKELEVIFKENYETQNVDNEDFENGTNGPSCRLLSGGARGGGGKGGQMPPQNYFLPPPFCPPSKKCISH